MTGGLPQGPEDTTRSVAGARVLQIGHDLVSGTGIDADTGLGAHGVSLLIGLWGACAAPLSVGETGG